MQTDKTACLSVGTGLTQAACIIAGRGRVAAGVVILRTVTPGILFEVVLTEPFVILVIFLVVTIAVVIVAVAGLRFVLLYILRLLHIHRCFKQRPLLVNIPVLAQIQLFREIKYIFRLD